MLPALLTLFATAPIVTAASVPKGANAPPTLYFPTAVGAKWVYERNGGEEEVEVAGVEKGNDSWVVSRKQPTGSATAYLSVTVSPAGLTQPKPTNGPGGEVWLMKTAAKPGDSWEVPDGRRTFVDAEEVKVTAGRYTARKVVWDGSDGERITFWYAPGVGEVKKVRRDAGGTQTVMRSLKSFTPGK